MNAQGSPPVARADRATVERGGEVTVLDTGERSVLANDSDADGDRLTARLERPDAGGGDGGSGDDGPSRDDDGGGPGAGGGDDDGDDGRRPRGRGGGPGGDDRPGPGPGRDDRPGPGRGRDDDRPGPGRGNRRDDKLALPPSHGTVTLRPDGTFVYRHGGGTATTDRFEYFAFDGALYSESAAVTIEIRTPTAAAPGGRLPASQTLAVPARGITADDFDGDGRIDLAAVTVNRTLIFFNRGARFDEAGTPIAEVGGDAVAATDWNRDGVPDLAVAGADGAAGTLLVNAADGTFAPLALTVAGAQSLLAADLRGNGTESLVLATDRGVVALENDGAGTATERTLLDFPAVHAAAADVDQNGFTDVIAVLADGSLAAVLNDGTNATATVLPAIGATGVASADADGDGDFDLLAAAETARGGSANPILRNVGAATFEPAGALAGDRTVMILTGDLNADRRTDAIVLNGNGIHRLHVAERDTFRTRPEEIRALGVSDALLADLTGDRALDLALAREEAGVIELYFGVGAPNPDAVAPRLELLGAPTITVTVNGTYDDPGALASDDVDGDLTDAIVVAGAIDTQVVGTYEIVYRVTDSAGNTSEAVRTVHVEPAAESRGGGGGAVAWPALLALWAAVTAAVGARRRVLAARWPR